MLEDNIPRGRVYRLHVISHKCVKVVGIGVSVVHVAAAVESDLN